MEGNWMRREGSLPAAVEVEVEIISRLFNALPQVLASRPGSSRGRPSSPTRPAIHGCGPS